MDFTRIKPVILKIYKKDKKKERKKVGHFFVWLTYFLDYVLFCDVLFVVIPVEIGSASAKGFNRQIALLLYRQGINPDQGVTTGRSYKKCVQKNMPPICLNSTM